MSHSAKATDEEQPWANPTICLDCGQTYFGTMECPSCREEEHRRSTESSAAPEEAAPSEPEQTKSAKTNPTICLDCGQTYIGTTECPSCVPRADLAPPAENIEITLPDDSLDEEEPIKAQVLLDEMHELGFEVTQAPEQ